jgi:hypothetical protein
MSAELDAVLAVYYRADATRTRTGMLQELRTGDRTRLVQAAYVAANAGAYDERGMPTTAMPERIAAQRELLERIAPEIEALQAQAAGEPVKAAGRVHA